MQTMCNSRNLMQTKCNSGWGGGGFRSAGKIFLGCFLCFLGVFSVFPLIFPGCFLCFFVFFWFFLGPKQNCAEAREGRCQALSAQERQPMTWGRQRSGGNARRKPRTPQERSRNSPIRRVGLCGQAAKAGRTAQAQKHRGTCTKAEPAKDSLGHEGKGTSESAGEPTGTKLQQTLYTGEQQRVEASRADKDRTPPHTTTVKLNQATG